MFDTILCSEKGPTSCRSPEAAGELPKEDALGRDPSEDPQSLNTFAVSVDLGSGVFVVGWDGPHDPSDPKR